MLDLNTLYNMDCMEGMKEFPDNYFDLAIVDPPYFSGPEKREYYGKRISTTGIERRNYHVSEKWKVPNDVYFRELLRVSKNQIIEIVKKCAVREHPKCWMGRYHAA